MSKADKRSIGPGSYHCGEVAELYQAHPQETHDTFYAWAQGCMSGMNIGVGGAGRAMAYQPEFSEAGSLVENLSIDLYPPGWDFERHWRYLLKYCDRHPMDIFALAVVDLYSNLVEAQNSEEKLR